MKDFKWPDMPFEKVPQSTYNFDDDYIKSHLSSETIYEFLKFCHKNGYRKLAGIITNKQRLFNIAPGSDHWTLTNEMLKKIFPKRKYNWNNPYKDGILIFSTGDDLVIDLPMKISQTQHASILKMLEQIHQFEKDFDTKVKYFDAEKVLNEANKKLTDNKVDDLDEVIVGIPLTEDLSQELLVETKETKEDEDWRDSADDWDLFYNDWFTWYDEDQINEYIEVDKKKDVQELVQNLDLEKQNQEDISKIHFC